jgi:predicted nucleotidyltransferase
MNDKELVSLITQHIPGTKLIYLFGSRAVNQQTKDSDWDVALLGDDKISPASLWRLSELLANKTRSEVDLIDLLQSTTVLNMQVVSGGRLLYDRGSFADTFEMQVFSMYGRLQESRIGIVDAFIADAKDKGASHG